jgi:hypothetical protein
MFSGSCSSSKKEKKKSKRTDIKTLSGFTKVTGAGKMTKRKTLWRRQLPQISCLISSVLEKVFVND